MVREWARKKKKSFPFWSTALKMPGWDGTANRKWRVDMSMSAVER
jgi:hypothetical protein